MGLRNCPAARASNRSAVRDDAMRQFFRTVDKAVERTAEGRQRPLIVVGVERNLAFYQEVDEKSKVAGRHARRQSRQNVSQRIGQAGLAGLRLGATRPPDAGAGATRRSGERESHASGVDQVWRRGRGEVPDLLVEKEFKYPADLSPEGDRLLPYTGKGARRWMTPWMKQSNE